MHRVRLHHRVQLMKYSVILFDADNTLFDFDQAEEQALYAVFEKNRLPMSDTTYQQYRLINSRLWTAFENKEITKDFLLAGRFAELFSTLQIDWPDPTRFNQEYLTCLGACPVLMSDASETCERLAQSGLTLAIVTNGVERVQKSRLERSEIRPWIQDVFVSEEVGYAKPNPAYFTYVFDRMRLMEKSDVLLVGDSLHSDIRGGIDFGIDTCWYNPRGLKNETVYRPTHQITKLMELIDIV